MIRDSLTLSATADSEPGARGALADAGGSAPPAFRAAAQPQAGVNVIAAAGPVSPALANHRALRARMGRPLDEQSLHRAERRFRPPAWNEGSVVLEDAMFLYDMARCVDPDRIIEIGTGSGVSSAILLQALADAGRGLCQEDGTPRLHSYDTMPCCYFDKSRPVAAAVHEMAPDLAAGLAIHIGVGAAAAAADHAERPVRFAFLDADHSHPWPIADMLALQPGLAPGAWVVVHDIQLPRRAREHEERTNTRVYWNLSGAERLFEAWPGEKIAGQFGAFNIGAIRMPDSGRLTAEHFKSALDQPFERAPNAAYMKLLGRA